MNTGQSGNRIVLGAYFQTVPLLFIVSRNLIYVIALSQRFTDAESPFKEEGAMFASKPLPVQAMALTACTLAQTLIHRLQRIHLLLSRTKTTEDVSIF